jgi:hypothetical protein
MRRFALVGILLMTAALGVGCSDDNDDEVFEAILSGSNEVPARATAANGRAHVIIHGDTVSFSVEVDDITNLTVSHIHTGLPPGGPTVNGPVRVNLYTGGPVVTTADKMVLAQGSFNSSGVTGISYDQLLSEIRAGNAYVNVHSQTFPGGEIRGQLRPVN